MVVRPLKKTSFLDSITSIKNLGTDCAEVKPKESVMAGKDRLIIGVYLYAGYLVVLCFLVITQKI